MAGRRAFIKLMAGGIILAAGGVGYVATRRPSSALVPWHTAAAGKPISDIRHYALSHAILAPNPHNRQPWIADLSEPDTIRLFCDANRKLPHTDPHDRQITIGLGCFSELLIMAAREAGHEVEMVAFPEGEAMPRLDDRPVAIFRFGKSNLSRNDPLFAEIFNRHTNRKAFDLDRPVGDGALHRIEAVSQATKVGSTNATDRVEDLRTFAWSAMDVELRTPRTYRESVDVMRIGAGQIDRNPDGIALEGPMIELFSTAGLLTREGLADVDSALFRHGLAALKAPFDTAMAFIWLTSPGNTRREQLRAGRDYVRIQLAATAEGLAMQPFSQALQEFPEMADHYRAIPGKLSVQEDATVQMFARLGYGPQIRPAPRWPYESRMREA